jgi:hypothetical protein
VISAAYLAHGDPHLGTEAALFWDAGAGTMDYNTPKAAWTALSYVMGGRKGTVRLKAFPSFTVAGLAHGSIYQFSILVRSASAVESLTPGVVEVVGDTHAPAEVLGASARGF